MRRRTLLAAAGLLTSGLAGCQTLLRGKSLPESKGPTRGEADANLSARLREPSGDVEYLPEQDAVRFPATRTGGNVNEYETAPWERWAKKQCASAARDVAINYTANRLDADIGGGTGDNHVFTQIATVIKDNEIDQRPAVDFNQLVAATPRSVESTYLLDGQRYTTDVPVYARHDVIRV